MLFFNTISEHIPFTLFGLFWVAIVCRKLLDWEDYELTSVGLSHTELNELTPSRPWHQIPENC